jgi:hypothetical protein
MPATTAKAGFFFWENSPEDGKKKDEGRERKEGTEDDRGKKEGGGRKGKR